MLKHGAKHHDRDSGDLGRAAHRKLAQSRYVPAVNRETPFPGWKRIDDMQSALPARDTGKTDAAGGQLTLFEYLDKLDAGDA